jgi:hypothetical protein
MDCVAKLQIAVMGRFMGLRLGVFQAIDFTLNGDVSGNTPSASL